MDGPLENVVARGQPGAILSSSFSAICRRKSLRLGLRRVAIGPYKGIILPGRAFLLLTYEVRARLIHCSAYDRTTRHKGPLGLRINLI